MCQHSLVYMSKGSVASCLSLSLEITSLTLLLLLQAHLANECEEVLVTCPVEGCNDKCTRKDVSILSHTYIIMHAVPS